MCLLKGDVVNVSFTFFSNITFLGALESSLYSTFISHTHTHIFTYMIFSNILHRRIRHNKQLSIRFKELNKPYFSEAKSILIFDRSRPENLNLGVHGSPERVWGGCMERLPGIFETSDLNAKFVYMFIFLG